MSNPLPLQTAAQQFPCKQCGANLVFAPGTRSLTCPYCGTLNEINLPEVAVEERDFEAELQNLERGAEHAETLTVKCDGCGAESTLSPNQTAGRCPFCGRALVAQAHTTRQLKPQYLLPFAITSQRASDAFKSWLGSLWFAPNDLKTYADRGGLSGIYIPAWTYDCGTSTRYTGQRGDDYWDTETYTTMENGRSVTRTRQVRKTRWHPASGRVETPFDDVVVLASQSLPQENLVKLEPWDLQSLVGYRDEYLAGFIAESYQIDLRHGFEIAKDLMVPQIESDIRSDIGGDHQRIASMDTKYFAITYKHILLPIWLSSYRYRGESYRFFVNARTGEVNGQRPYSAIKITLFILMCLVIVAVIALIASAQGGR